MHSENFNLDYYICVEQQTPLDDIEKKFKKFKKKKKKKKKNKYNDGKRRFRIRQNSKCDEW